MLDLCNNETKCVASNINTCPNPDAARQDRCTWRLNQPGPNNNFFRRDKDYVIYLHVGVSHWASGFIDSIDYPPMLIATRYQGTLVTARAHLLRLQVLWVCVWL